MMAVFAMGSLVSCSDDYEEASSPHVYGETENPPLKGSDATNLVSASVRMKQAEAGTEVATVNLADYSGKMEELLGLTLEQVMAGMADGSVRFMPVNPNRRLWDKSPANAGNNAWALSAGGVVMADTAASAVMRLVPESREVKISLTQRAAAGIIPVTFGFVKTDDTAYPTNMRIQVLVNVVDASVCDVSVTVPQGDYASASFKFGEIAKNIAFAFGETDLRKFASGLDTGNPVYDVFVMTADGSLKGGPGNYTANGAGYWLNQDMGIVNWGKDGFALYIEPNIWDYDAEAYHADGGGFNIGRLSNTTPASGAVLNLSIVIKKHNAKDNDKSLTINFAITFE